MISKRQRKKAARNMKARDPVKRSLAGSLMEARKEQKRRKCVRRSRRGARRR